ncbi:TPA: hypothetical protein ACGWAT_002208 [Enterococcus faecium]|nr:hypothetical protein [Enterococcus faecium]HAP6157466.1 hypothetical protein [Enterococcus faecium]
MKKELSTLDQYLADPDWGKSNLQLVANKYEKSIDEAIVALTDAASITADDSKWTKRDLGILKRGVNWLEDQYREETKEK